MDLDSSLSWLALQLTPGLGARLTGKLLRQFGSPEEVFHASLTELEACRLPAATAQAVHSRAGFRDAEKELAEVRRLGCHLLHWDETSYPQRLLEIYDPPPLLYVRGDPRVLARHSLAMVGTRRPTPYGNQIAERLARDLAERGLVIVSGLARGVDSSAHRGACAASRGTTVGVLGCGIDVVYPKENRKLFGEVEKRGAIISEFTLGSLPRAGEFSGAQPHRCRDDAGHRRGAGRTIFRLVDFGAAGDGIWARSIWRAGQRHRRRELCAEPVDKAGREASDGLGGRGGGSMTEIRAEMLFPVDTTSAAERAASLCEESLSAPEKKLYRGSCGWKKRFTWTNWWSRAD